LAKRTAIIDIGSNSIRLVLFEKTSRFAFHLINETKSRVRLSEDCYKNDGYLQEKAMQRTLSALVEFQSIIKSLKAMKTLCVATSALRDAPNKKEFLQRVKSQTNIQIKVIDGKKEAYLGGLASANLLAQKSGLCIDIGGGSTEFAIIKNQNIIENISLNIGTVRLKELYFDKEDIEGAKNFIDKELEQLSLTKSKNLIGIGGTFRAISKAILEGINHPITILHNFQFSKKRLKNYLQNVLYANDKELKELGIKKERFDVIRPGALILLRVLKKVDIQTAICSTAGVREGVYLQDLLRNNKFKFPANYNVSVKSLSDRFILHPKHSSMREHIALKIATLIQDDFSISAEELKVLRVAARLSSLGKSINFQSYHLHSEMLIENGLSYGFTHGEIILISTLIRFHRKRRLDAEYKELFAEHLPSYQHFEVMSFIVALSEILLMHHPRQIDFTISYKDTTLFIKGPHCYLAQEKLSNTQLPENLDVKFV